MSQISAASERFSTQALPRRRRPSAPRSFRAPTFCILDPGSCVSHLTRRPFTLIEIVVVICILGLICGLVVPRIGRLPRRVVVESALSAVRTAFRDAGMRARATGRSVKLVLDAEGRKFRIQNDQSGVSHGVPGVSDVPPEASSADPDQPAPPSILSKLEQYDLPKDLTWHADELDLEPDEAPCYFFFPDGAASGPAMEFTVRKTRFRLSVDHLTGHCQIDEIDAH